MTTPLPRPLPAGTHLGRCNGCDSEIVWAITTAGPNGRGGKHMALDPIENYDGNAAARFAGGRLVVRILCKDETPDRSAEYHAMPHVATCPTHTKPELPENVVDLATRRRSRKGRTR